MTITIREEELVLAKERAIYFPQQQLLAISDLHIGKTAHFRKSGIQIPATLAQNDFRRLSLLIDRFSPSTLLINGDMFHHRELNSDVEYFAQWRSQYAPLKLLLVKGNHDKLQQQYYEQLDISVHEQSYSTSNFCFIHDAMTCKEENRYPISGHVHPGVNIVGKAKQRLSFPCFYFGTSYAIMPAFSEFTGLYMVKPKLNEQVFAITPNQVIKV
jgi:DNA ligase-associated metallophosphoesterase